MHRFALLLLWLTALPASGGLETLYLTADEKVRVEKQIGAELRSTVVRRKRDGDLVVYLDRHKVRTLPETLGISINQSGRVDKVEILNFAEPRVYKPRPKWLEQFLICGPDELPTYKGNIDGISGATLSGRAVSDAVRRSLVLHKVLESRP